MRPAQAAEIAEWLAELYLITAKREGDDQDFKARLIAYANRLAVYPADLVKTTILGWRGVFFPALEEIRQKIEARRDLSPSILRDRQYKIEALENYLSPAPEAAGVVPFRPRGTP